MLNPLRVPRQGLKMLTDREEKHSPGKNPGMGCRFLLQGDLSDPGIEPGSPMSLALSGRFLTTGATWEKPFHNV